MKQRTRAELLTALAVTEMKLREAEARCSAALSQTSVASAQRDQYSSSARSNEEALVRKIRELENAERRLEDALRVSAEWRDKANNALERLNPETARNARLADALVSVIAMLAAKETP